MNSRSKKRLPSVETQTVEFVESALGHSDISRRWLEFNGFYVFLRYCPRFTVADVVLENVLVIANVEIPEKYRNRGWFWRYCQLCAALVEGGVVAESVVNIDLRRSLTKKSGIEELQPGHFFLAKKTSGVLPLLGT